MANKPPYMRQFPDPDTSYNLSSQATVQRDKSSKDLSSSLPAEFNSKLKSSFTKSKSQEAGLQFIVSSELDIERELDLLIQEQLEQQPVKKKYSTVTIPLSVRYSTMAVRPKSPKRSMSTELGQDNLDQTIMDLREQLGLLSSERAAMEQQMDELIGGIDEARVQCHNQCRQRAIATGINRGRSSTYSPRNTPRKFKHSPPQPKKGTGSPTNLLSPDSVTSNPEQYFTVGRHRSVSSTDSGYGSLKRISKSSEKLRTRHSSIANSSPNVSLSQGSESIGSDWLSNPTIPELPESPLNKATSSRAATRMRSNPTHYSSYTTGRHYRSHSATIVAPVINITSSPDLSARRRHDSQPYIRSANRNSLPESAMNKIMEDETDSASITDSLSQASLSQQEEGSPKSQGSTVIVRRSSLTGQVEHIRKPRKRNSFNGSSENCLLKDSGSKSSSTMNLSGTKYAVLNTGYKKNRRRSRVVLQDSRETTV